MRKLLESKMKDVPAEQRELIMTVLEKNPEFFQKIAEEIKALQDSGKDSQAAMMEVMGRHQAELARIMQDAQK